MHRTGILAILERGMGVLYTTVYDVALRAVPNICWLPWIGENYPRVQKKLLVVGHSYRGQGVMGKKHAMPGKPDERARQWKVDHIDNHAEGMYQGKYHFPNAIDGILTGRGRLSAAGLVQIPLLEMQELWGKIAFTNFIQNYSGDDSLSEIKRSQGVLNGLCEIVQPTHICMFALAKQELSSWPYVRERKPSILQTPYPTGRGGWRYDRQAHLFQAVIDGWGVV